MIIRIYPVSQNVFKKDVLNIHIEVEFDKIGIKYFWLIVWRLNKKITKDFFIFIIRHIMGGQNITAYPDAALNVFLQNHPELEKKLGVDSEHVIIDKALYHDLRHEGENK